MGGEESPSRSLTSVTIAACRSTPLAASAVLSQRSDCLSARRRSACGASMRPRRVQIRPATSPKAPPVCASTPSIACSKTPRPPPLADLAEAAPAIRRRGEIDLAGVLDRQHVPPGASRRRRRSPTLDQAVHAHLRIGQKPRKADDPAPPAARYPSQAHALARHHPLQKLGSLFSSRSSPNVAKDSTKHMAAPPPVRRNKNHKSDQPRQSQTSHQRCVHALAARGGGNASSN